MGSDEKPGAEHLALHTRESQVLLDRLEKHAEDYPRLAELQHWQRARLQETYADLKRQSRFELACVFFLEELYGGRDMQARDAQLERARPVMSRMLPDHLLHAVGEAMRLQWMSMDLDARLSQALEGELDQAEYARAYRRLDVWDARQEQIRLIDDLGRLLKRTVAKPMIRRLVRWMHAPAVAAGFGKLQEFLSEGLEAFGEMGADADYFVDTIVDRETRALERMRQGSDQPFDEWIGGGPEV
ncbi:MAG: hypothetical protein CMP07_14760 [Xanthomonadales bacterium]|nr:hypothetical protein [Xanthomonadales bacterium]